MFHRTPPILVIAIASWCGAVCCALAADLPTGSRFYVSNKVYTDPAVHSWATATPSAVGLTGSALDSAAKALKGDRNFRAMLVARNGYLVYESYTSATAQQARNIHSASKSILSATIGLAIDDGVLSLNTTLQESLGVKFAVPSSKRSITVEHLLSMTSGIAWVEDSTEYSKGLATNRIQGILNLKQSATPGTRYNYSTGDATLLAAVLTEATHESYASYASRKLLAPLNITVEGWGIDPQGYNSGGCNFFITPREMLRFGQAAIDAKKSRPSPIDRDWLHAATLPRSNGYGLMWWTDIGDGNFRAWGWGQQFIYVFPAQEVVVVTAYDTASRVRDSDNYSTIKRYVLGAM